MYEIRTLLGRIRVQANMMDEVRDLDFKDGAVPVAIAMVSASVDDLAHEIAQLRTAVAVLNCTEIAENTKELARIADNLTPKQ